MCTFLSFRTFHHGRRREITHEQQRSLLLSAFHGISLRIRVKFTASHTAISFFPSALRSSLVVSNPMGTPADNDDDGIARLMRKHEHLSPSSIQGLCLFLFSVKLPAAVTRSTLILFINYVRQRFRTDGQVPSNTHTTTRQRHSLPVSTITGRESGFTSSE